MHNKYEYYCVGC